MLLSPSIASALRPLSRQPHPTAAAAAAAAGRPTAAAASLRRAAVARAATAASFPSRAAAAAAPSAAAAAAAGWDLFVFQRRCWGSSNLLQRISGSGGSSQQPRQPESLRATTSHAVFKDLMRIEERGRKAAASLLDREGRMQKKQQLLLQQFYAFYIKQLMDKQGEFALQDFLVLKRRLLGYLQQCEDELGGLRRKAARQLGKIGLKAFKEENSKEVKQMQTEISILESLTPSELRLTCPSGLSPLTLKTVAASAGVSLKEVEMLLLQFSTMQGDRHWFMRLLELGRPLPGSFEDRHLLAETDRPYEIRLPYGETFYNYEVEQTRKLLKARGDGRGDRRRARNERKLSIRCRLYHPQRRLWRDRWTFFPDSFADPYSNFAARRLYLQQKYQQQQRRKQLPKGYGIKRRRQSLEQLHAGFVKRLPTNDPQLRNLLQQAADAERPRRQLLPRQLNSEGGSSHDGNGAAASATAAAAGPQTLDSMGNPAPPILF